MYILWLDDKRCQEKELAGSKAANLSRLIASYPIPPGFCLTTAAWSLLGETGADTVSPARLPSAVYEQLSNAYRILGERCGVASPAVAVRSSAVDEDGLATSFAGQHETYLNIVGIKSVTDAALGCWASAHSERVQEYRRQRGLAPDEVRLAVLIQQLVAADVSAVAFSVNPVTGEDEEVVINATWGLGESLVGGSVTPDTYTVRKSDLNITSRQIAEKAHTIIPDTSGTHVGEVPSEKRLRPALQDEQIVQIAHLVCELETRMSWPVDVECAYQNGQLYLLQCRPVTTHGIFEPQTSSIEWQTPDDAALTWSLNKQAFSKPLTPLMQSYLPFHTQGWVRDSRAHGTVGEIRIRFEHGYAYFVWQPTGLTAWEEADRQAIRAEQATPERWKSEFLPLLHADHARVRSLHLASLAEGELSQALQETLTAQIQHFAIHAHIATFSYSATERLVNWYLQRFPDAPETEPYRLVEGERNTSIEDGHRLWQLSQMLSEEARQALRSGDWEQLPEDFRQVWNSYLEEFGHRTHALADPGSPTWQEDPTPVAQLVLSYAQNNVADPYIEMQQLAADREAFTSQVRAQLTPEDRQIFDTLLECALANYPLTEDHNHWIDQQSPADVRLLCAEFGRRMTARGVLDDEADISFLSLSELILWGFGLADPLRSRIAQRKAEHAANRRRIPPDYLGAPPQPQTWVDRFGGPVTPLAAEQGAIRGVGASAGRVSGQARVVRTLGDAQQLKQGEILVCMATDPNWTPLFAVTAALVTDTGGSLSHAAVIAREYHLPAVVGTHTATKILQTGQIIEVDGLSGIVRILSLP